MKSLFGSQGKQVPSQSGYGALPPEIQGRLESLAKYGGQLVTNPEQYFAPMDLTEEELAVQSMLAGELDPAAYQKSIEGYMSPYRDILYNDINEQFRAPQGALASQISEAGAFGGTRARGASAQLEKARLGAINSALAGMYGQALDARQQGIQNMLGFGGLRRDVDLAQRGALPQALLTQSQILSPMLSSSTGGYTTGAKSGLLGGIGKVAGLVGSVAGALPTGGASMFGLSTGGQGLFNGGFGNMMRANQGYYGPGF